jgi:hypothetical protein
VGGGDISSNSMEKKLLLSYVAGWVGYDVVSGDERDESSVIGVQHR